MTTTQWSTWLTEDRLARWNHLRHLAFADPIDREVGVSFLSKLAEQAKTCAVAKETLRQIRERLD